MLTEELTKIKEAIGVDRFAKGKFEIARDLFDKMTTNDEFAEFLTLPGYEKLDWDRRALARYNETVFAGRRGARARQRAHRAHACAARRGKTLATVAERRLRRSPWRVDWQSSDATGQSGPESNRRERMAGGCGRKSSWPNVSRSKFVPGEQRAGTR